MPMDAASSDKAAFFTTSGLIVLFLSPSPFTLIVLSFHYCLVVFACYVVCVVSSVNVCLSVVLKIHGYISHCYVIIKDVKGIYF